MITTIDVNIMMYSRLFRPPIITIYARYYLISTISRIEMKYTVKWLFRYKYTLLFLACLCIIYLYFNQTYEGYTDTEMNKTIWILWLQGWDSAPWLPQQVVQSWRVQNPGWSVILVTETNLKEYVDDIDYLYSDSISPQAKSDIVRLSLLSKHGGVWADATLLCLQPLDSWIEDSLRASNFWMYHGTGGGMDIMEGPASWFIVSKKGSYIINKWKDACDTYWNERSSTDNYFWMDALFRRLYTGDAEFKAQWDAVPYISCEDPGQSHMFASGSWKENTESIKNILRDSPPRVVKLWEKRWSGEFPVLDDRCKESNGYYAIQKAIRATD